MKTNILLFLVIGLFLFACKKDEKPVTVVDDGKGDLFVTIKYMNGTMPTPKKGVKITTVPATQEAITDANGNVLFRDVAVGHYDLYADLVGYVQGKASVDVIQNNTQDVYVTILSGIELGFVPVLDVLLPLIPANFSLNDNVVFSLNVRDNNTTSQNLKVMISSDLDGKLTETYPDLNNNVRFETTSLSGGIHQITVTATDIDKNVTTKTFALSTLYPGKIKLDTAYVNNGSIRINWQKYIQNDFDRYEIFRTTDPNAVGQLVTSINTATTLNYIDNNAPIVNSIYYYIRVYNKAGLSVNSNKVKVDLPSGKIYSYWIIDAVHNPVKPIIYIVDKYSNNLKAINYETDTEINSISIPGTPGKIEIGDNGSGIDANGNNVEVYVPSSNGNIYVYDANTLNLVRTIVTGEQNMCVATSGHGYIVVTVGTQWDKPTRTFSTKTGQFISSMNGGWMGEFIRFIPNTDKIFTITVGMSPVLSRYYELTGTGTFSLFVGDTYFGNHPLDPKIFKMSPNGQFFITSSQGAVYTTSSSNNFKGLIPKGALLFSDYEFSKDGNTIYGATANRTSVQIIKYPDLTRSDEYLTKGFPHYIFYYNGNLITISEAALNSFKYAVEKIKVE